MNILKIIGISFGLLAGTQVAKAMDQKVQAERKHTAYNQVVQLSEKEIAAHALEFFGSGLKKLTDRGYSFSPEGIAAYHSWIQTSGNPESGCAKYMQALAYVLKPAIDAYEQQVIHGYEDHLKGWAFTLSLYSHNPFRAPDVAMAVQRVAWLLRDMSYVSGSLDDQAGVRCHNIYFGDMQQTNSNNFAFVIVGKIAQDSISFVEKMVTHIATTRHASYVKVLDQLYNQALINHPVKAFCLEHAVSRKIVAALSVGAMLWATYKNRATIKSMPAVKSNACAITVGLLGGILCSWAS